MNCCAGTQDNNWCSIGPNQEQALHDLYSRFKMMLPFYTMHIDDFDRTLTSI